LLNLSAAKILNNLAVFLADHPDQPILIAYSGGVDSQVLLHALASLKQQQKIHNSLHVCHVNHGLSANAAKWQQFAVQQCRQQNVELTICSVNIERKSQQSIEALARNARYRALQTTANKLADHNVVVITGHHQDDQCETFLLALKRGSGLKGLSAMGKTSVLGNHLLARPLLKCSREDIEQYAKSEHLSWVEDESNSDTCFDRNFLRQIIIPPLKKRWPSISATIARSSQHCQDGQQLLNELAIQDLASCEVAQASEPTLMLSYLLALSELRFNNVLRYFIAKQHLLMPSSEQLHQVRQQLMSDGEKSPAIKISNYFIRRFQQQLMITRNFEDIQHYTFSVKVVDLLANKIQLIELPDKLGKLEIKVLNDNLQSVELNDSITLLLLNDIIDINSQHLIIRFNHDNPKCLPQYRQHSRALKKVLQELTIAPWQRKRIPFIYLDKNFAAALGHFACKEFVVDNTVKINQPVIAINWLKE